MEITFDRALAIVGLISTIVLLVADKAGKLKGPILLVLLGVAILMMLPLTLSISWVKDTPWGMLKFSKIFLMCSITGLIYSVLALWISPTPVNLIVSATSFAGDYLPNTEIVGFKWMPETTDVRLTLINDTESDFENLDLKFGSDLLTMTVLQITRVPNISFVPQDDGKIKLPPAAAIGKDKAGKSVIIPTAPSSPQALILSSYYRLLCERLPRREKIQLLLPSRTTNPWNGNPNDYFTHKRNAQFITVKGEFFANDAQQIVDVKIIPVVQQP